jgi:hypothetical protein
MQPVNPAGLAIVFRNPEPHRELQYPNTWLLQAERQTLKIFVVLDGAKRPRIVRREAA